MHFEKKKKNKIIRVNISLNLYTKIKLLGLKHIIYYSINDTLTNIVNLINAYVTKNIILHIY